MKTVAINLNLQMPRWPNFILIDPQEVGQTDQTGPNPKVDIGRLGKEQVEVLVQDLRNHIENRRKNLIAKDPFNEGATR